MEGWLLDHVIAAVERAPLEAEPFSHSYVENVFPADVYEEILSSLPAAQHFEPLYHKDALRPDGGTTRSTFTLDAAHMATLPAQQRNVLARVETVIGSEALRDALLSRYCDVLRQRFGDGWRSVPLEGTVKLQRDTPGYRIGVHPDTADKVVLLQLYLARDDAHRSMGTSIYRCTGPEVYERVDTLAFARNSGFSFARTAESWHGVEPIDAERYSLTLNYRLRNQRLWRGFRKRVVRQARRFARRLSLRPAARLPRRASAWYPWTAAPAQPVSGRSHARGGAL
jgi:hypothetical protein